MTEDQQRPAIENIKTSAELYQWYWPKSELVSYARQLGIGSNCQKPELTKRLGVWLDTGKITHNTSKKKTSKFDWRNSTLSLSTVITDNYSNTQNVRHFMHEHTNGAFKFSNGFMHWMRSNCGKNLQDAQAFWTELNYKKRNDGYREKALPQNQYNQFTRTLSEKAPGISTSEIQRIWAIKRSKPGPHVYRDGDENL